MSEHYLGKYVCVTTFTDNITEKKSTALYNSSRVPNCRNSIFIEHQNSYEFKKSKYKNVCLF